MDELFYELFDGMPRLGPGADEATMKALNKVYKNNGEKKVLDIGCGTGAQTLLLAKNIRGKIIALDNYQPFLDQIESKTVKEELKARIKCVCMDMKNIVCKHASLDIVWGEGSIYIVGFSKGLKMVYPLMKDKAYVVFSDMNYLKDDPPAELVQFLKEECPDIITIEENIDLIEKSPFKLIDHFKLKKKDHWNPYYKPLEKRVEEYSKKYRDNSEALSISSSIQYEIDMYKKYSDYYGYVFYIMQKP